MQDSPVSPAEFSEFLLDKLGIPQIRFPQGNPYSERSWPHLSWRMLLRHIYRQEDYWNDVAPKQPESEQLACLMQFLGVAKDVFPQEYGELVENRKLLFKLEARKEQFTDMLSEISKEILAYDGLSVTLTPESIDIAIADMKSKIDGLQAKRIELLGSLRSAATTNEQNPGVDSQGRAVELGDEWAKLRAERDAAADELAKVSQRFEDLTNYQQLVEQELSRLKRTQGASHLLADLRFTTCPVCDQAITPTNQHEELCFLCHRPYSHDTGSPSHGNRRIEFEVEQLQEALKENKQLIGELTKSKVQLTSFIRQADDKIKRVEQLLKPMRIAVASIIPPELAEIDQETGRLHEQIRQLEGLKNLLNSRDHLSAEIDETERMINELDRVLSSAGNTVNFEQSSDKLSDGMNTYLNELNRGGSRWPKDQVRFELRERRFRILVDGGVWSSELGATLQCYLFMSYHYALMGLSNDERFNYPGLVIADFPPTLADGTEVADKENYLIEPFIQMLSRPGMHNTQMIVAGRAFEDLEGANRIELTTIWK